MDAEVKLDEQYEFTTAELLAAIKRQPAGTTFYARVRERAPIAGEPNKEFPIGLNGSVRLSRPQALKLAAGLLSKPLEERGGRIPSSLYGSGRYRAFYVV